ncbi:hypothetical protein [Acrocarpospora sp. B8E8]
MTGTNVHRRFATAVQVLCTMYSPADMELSYTERHLPPYLLRSV